jgi:4-amino-4-deoxy-L-arabinose transferase-like glycosyltransferase
LIWGKDMKKVVVPIASNSLSPVQRFSWLAVILVAATLLRLWAFVGIVGSDDVAISALASRLLESGPWVPETHYQARIGLSYPLAVIYAVFGVGEWQTVVIPFCAGVLSVILTFLIAERLCGGKAALLAALVIAVFPLDVAAATQLMPDLPLGVVLAASFYFALLALESDRGVVWAAVAGLTWGYAYLIKIEAAFLAVPMFVLLLANLPKWRVVLWVFAGAAAVVATESIVYWIGGGEIVQRLAAVSNQGNLKATREFSASQLWVFPKSWFVTFYAFGLHYYLLFAALIWVLIGRVKALYVVAAWAAVYLLWLQFGGNPFSGSYHVKSHLDRYCSMLSVPMAVLIGAFLQRVLELRPRMGALVLGGTLAAGLFFISFNTLSFERQDATKIAIDYARKENLFPLYMDRTSYAIAGIYMNQDPRFVEVRTAQDYDFQAQKMQLVDLKQADGYVWEVIFVDDDSPDGTALAVRELASTDSRVRVLHRIHRRGLSSACIEGMLASAAPYVAVMDADLQHDERLLPRMLAALKDDGLDIVVGSRNVAGGSMGDWASERELASRFATRLSGLVLKADLKDPMSGFFMLRRELIDEVVHDLSGIGFKICSISLSPLSVRCVSGNCPIPFVIACRREQARQRGRLAVHRDAAG